ncbi:MAG: SLC13 family permease [Xanthobacteraceae bacterium]
MITTSLIVSCLIFFLIAIRQWLPSALRIWHIMVAGAVALLVLREISPSSAFWAVDWDVIAYLFGVFVIAAALYDSGISHAIGARIAAMRHPHLALFVLIVATALGSAVLTNDAAAVIGTPIILMLAQTMRLPAVPLLIALCAAVTVGSMISPVGNPQNILIATSGHVNNPVVTFAWWLTVPTVASLVFVFYWSLRLMAKAPQPAQREIEALSAPASNARTWPAYVGTALLVVLIVAGSVLQGLNDRFALPFGIASLIACAPIFLFSNRRVPTFKEIDWPTLAFFVAMFVVTGSLLQSGSLQALLGSLQSQLGEPPVTAAISFWASQLFSNVPVVDIYLKLLPHGEIPNLMMLAGMSTLAGNLFIISAASNVIVVQQAERFGEAPFTFWQFTLAVLPITLVSVGVTYGWIIWMGA